jgi:hypothetical protein
MPFVPLSSECLIPCCSFACLSQKIKGGEGHPQVLKLFVNRTAVISRYSCLLSLYLLSALFLVVRLRACH